MPPFSFIHTADLHLDSPFSTLARENSDIASAMRSATFRAFENIIELCIKKQVDFLLIAGDVYDGEDRSLRAQIRFRDGLKKLSDAGIAAFVVHGNHDPVGSWSTSLDWPENVHIFGDQPESFQAKRGNELLAVIHGISYPKRNEKRNLSLKLKKSDEPAFQIGLLHANAGANTGHEPYAPCTIEDLKKANMDYWALGHVHEKRILSEEGPVIIYPGNSQGRSIRETGEKGCCLINVDESGKIEKEFLSTHAIRWETAEIQAGDITAEQELINRLENKCIEISENNLSTPVIVRFIITGRGPLSNIISNPQTVNDLLEITRDAGISCSPFVWPEKIKTDMSPELDLDTIINQEDFAGELLRFSEELTDTDEFENFIKEELSPLFENSRAGKIITVPAKRKLHSLLKEARNICMEGLFKEDAK